MYALKYETTIDADHRLTIDLPDSFPVGEAEVIVLAKAPAAPEARVGESLDEFFAWLDTLPPTGRTKEEIDAQIREERDAWGD